jgi:diadenosine tetraphosphatase ApaH/serine/threonine PP2A family protein phosphatase
MTSTYDFPCDENSIADVVLEKLLTTTSRKYFTRGSSKSLTAATAESPTEEKLTFDEVSLLLSQARNIFLSEPLFLKLKNSSSSSSKKWENYITGRFVGNFRELMRVFESVGGIFNIFYPGSRKRMIFLGDYVDRGPDSVQVFCLLCALKIKFPQNIFLLRGQHECADINRTHGFYDECKKKYHVKLWKRFFDLFNILPVRCLLVDEKVLCTPSGLTPHANNLLELELLLSEISDLGKVVAVYEKKGKDQQNECISNFGPYFSQVKQYLRLEKNDDDVDEIDLEKYDEKTKRKRIAEYERRCVLALTRGSEGENSSVVQNRVKMLTRSQILSRPFNVPEKGVITDLLWAAPDDEVEGWHKTRNNPSYTFGPDVVEKFIKNSTCSLEDDEFDTKNNHHDEQREKSSRIELIVRMSIVDPDDSFTHQKCVAPFAKGKMFSFLGPSFYREFFGNYGCVLKVWRDSTTSNDGLHAEPILIGPKAQVNKQN